MIPSKRTRLEDIKFNEDSDKIYLGNHLLIRASALDKRFTSVNFMGTIFDSCYFRNCTFVSCDFTGCRFLSSQLQGSHFSICKFDYAVFERTFIDDAILDSEAPRFENVRARFARSLRMNYQQLGDARGANRAIKVELSARETHLYKASFSKETYFREKYKGLRHFFTLG